MSMTFLFISKNNIPYSKKTLSFVHQVHYKKEEEEVNSIHRIEKTIFEKGERER